MTEKHIITINDRVSWNCNKLRSRKIWEALYRNCGGKDFSSFDNFLIDLRCFEDQLNRRLDDELIEFYWSYTGDGTHTSEDITSIFGCCDKSYRITYDHGKRSIIIAEIIL